MLFKSSDFACYYVHPKNTHYYKKTFSQYHFHHRYSKCYHVRPKHTHYYKKHFHNIIFTIDKVINVCDNKFAITVGLFHSFCNVPHDGPLVKNPKTSSPLSFRLFVPSLTATVSAIPPSRPLRLTPNAFHSFPSVHKALSLALTPSASSLSSEVGRMPSRRNEVLHMGTTRPRHGGINSSR